MSDVAEKAGEVAGEVVEETIDGVVDVVTVVRNNPKMLALAGVLGAVAGGVGAYFIAKTQLKSYYEDLATQEIAEAKVFYAGVYKTDDEGETLTPLEVLEQRHGAEAAAEAVRRYQGQNDNHVELVHEEGCPAGEYEGRACICNPVDEQDEALLARTEANVRTPYRQPSKHDDMVTEKTEVDYEKSMPASVRNTFDSNSFNLEEEKTLRTEEAPYIVTHDEYFTNDDDYDLVALTYFENDRTLVYEMDELKPVDDVDGLIGRDHLVRFGSGSGDEEKVYVRNDKVQNMYEITRSTGSYAEEVLGLMGDEPDSLRHSNRNAVLNRRRQFRRGADE